MKQMWVGASPTHMRSHSFCELNTLDSRFCDADALIERDDKVTQVSTFIQVPKCFVSSDASTGEGAYTKCVR